MLIKNAAYANDRVQSELVSRFATLGIGRERLEFVGHTPGLAAHLAQYAHVDIALDTFPYGGTTTTCDAMWMGVPVITMTGRTHASRVGASLLACVGLSELVRGDVDGFAEVTAALAADASRLTTLRAGMRERLRGSMLLDGPGYARRFERALLTMCAPAQ
jgi:predicted O-linked N-acetylglucosamine transferase (SPINDLY family)